MIRRLALAVFTAIVMAACASPNIDSSSTWPTGGSIAVAPLDTGATAGTAVALAAKGSSLAGPFAVPTSGPDAPVWSTDDPTIATVDQRGVVTGHAPGTTLVHAKAHGSDVYGVFNVLTPIAAVGISMRDDRLVVPASFRIRAALRSAAGDSMVSDFQDIVWSSSDTTVAKVTPYHDPGYPMRDAMLTLTGYGTARITLTAVREQLSGSIVISPAPIQYRVVRYGAHENFTGLACALDVDGRPYCWSRNLYTQTIPGQWFTVAGDTTPVPLALKTNLVFDSLTVGFEHACGLTHTGEAWCWGDDDAGQAGIGRIDYGWFTTPQQVTGGHHFLNISAADGRTCGAATDGQAYCWGANSDNDDFGNGSPGNFLNPVPAATGVQLTSIWLDGSSHNAGASCGMSTVNVAICWGINALGATGIGQVTAHIQPPMPVLAPEQFVSVVPGGEHTCGLGASGQAYCWGNAQGGALTLPDELRGYPTPMPVSGGVHYRALRAALYHTCGIALDQSVWCWGLNFGINPARINIPDAVTDLDASIFTNCAVTVKHQSWCWSGVATDPEQTYGGP